MSSPLDLKINIEEFCMPADGDKKCEQCKELITGKMYQPVIFVNNEEAKRDYWYCHYCYHEQERKE